MSDPVQKLLRDGYAKTIKRGPVPPDMFGGIKLGTALEVELCSGHVIRWSREKPVLFWSYVAKFLGLAEGWPKKPTSRINLKGSDQADSLFRDFHGRNAKVIKSYENVQMSDRWVALGDVCRIDYHSTKNGRRASYTHDHGRGVKLYRLGSSNRAIWVIKGGSLTVTSRGIVN